MKKTFDYYMGLPYTMNISASPEGGFVGKIEELPGCITQGDTMDEVLTNLKDAKAGWIEIALEDNAEIPEPTVN